MVNGSRKKMTPSIFLRRSWRRSVGRRPQAHWPSSSIGPRPSSASSSVPVVFVAIRCNLRSSSRCSRAKRTHVVLRVVSDERERERDATPRSTAYRCERSPGSRGRSACRAWSEGNPHRSTRRCRRFLATDLAFDHQHVMERQRANDSVVVEQSFADREHVSPIAGHRH